MRKKREGDSGLVKERYRESEQEMRKRKEGRGRRSDEKRGVAIER